VHRGLLEWYYLSTIFHEILPSGSKCIIVGHTDRKAGDLISLLSFFESTLKKNVGLDNI
jgi:hypothetical protein